MGEIKTAISVKDISFSYNDNLVFENASIDFPANCFTVILGKNGSGKSTLLRIIAGLQIFKYGKIFFGNEDMQVLPLQRRSRLFGFLAQHHIAVFPFTVEDVVLTGRVGYISYTPSKRDKEISYDALKKTGIEHLGKRYYTELSGGEQQLVMIARVLAQEPSILLLDEPTSHLDFCNQANLLQLLKNLVHGGLTVIAVLHDPNAAFLYSDDFIFVKEKKLIRSEISINPWDSAFLESVYNTPLQSVPFMERALIVPLKKNTNDGM